VPKVIMDSNFIELYNVIILNYRKTNMQYGCAVFFILWLICG
jgi:hypothetical protein